MRQPRFQAVEELELPGEDADACVREGEPRDAIDLGELADGSRPAWPLQFEGARDDRLRVEVALDGPGPDELAAGLSDLAERQGAAGGRGQPEFLAELAASRIERFLVRSVLTLRQRPRAMVSTCPERSTGVGEQDLHGVAATTQDEQSSAATRHVVSSSGLTTRVELASRRQGGRGVACSGASSTRGGSRPSGEDARSHRSGRREGPGGSRCALAERASLAERAGNDVGGRRARVARRLPSVLPGGPRASLAIGFVFASTVAGLSLLAGPASATGSTSYQQTVDITLLVASDARYKTGAYTYRDDYDEPRSRGSHGATDIMADAGTPVYAARAGRVTLITGLGCGSASNGALNDPPSLTYRVAG